MAVIMRLEGDDKAMATSSITHNFVIEGKERVERFANAIEASWNEVIPERPPMQACFITDIKEALALLDRGLMAQSMSLQERASRSLT